MKKTFTNRTSSPPFGTSVLGQGGSQHWFIRYKLYHLIFWFIYHYIWTVINVGNPVEVFEYILSTPKFHFYVIFQAIAVYFTLYFLIPRYLEKGKYSLFLIFFSFTVTIAASLIVTGYYLTAYLKNTTMLTYFGNESFSHFFLTYALPSTLTSLFLAMSIKLTKNWLESRKREQLLEKEKLETELKFLRSQLNPHFLFNSINSIFVLIHKNPDMASESLAKFSNLLRYQLYECNEAEISLRKEFHYLENYIELERLRMDHQHLKLHVEFDPLPGESYTIAPLLLIPFAENAFKHVSKGKHRLNQISLRLSFDDGRLAFTVNNTVDGDQNLSREFIKSSGIGLKNVQRRLNLIYPENHLLRIEKTRDEFKVALEISLHEQSVEKMAEVEDIDY